MALLASITLFAAAFLVLNATSMTVVERIRELGLLRAAGATRGQLVRIVEVQALLLGSAGSLLGVVAGAALALLVAAWLGAVGSVTLDAPEVTAPVLLAGLAVGILVTLVAALEPARRAASVSPVTALRARSDAAAGARARVGWLIVVVVAVGAMAILLLPVTAASPMGLALAVAIYALMLLGILVTPALLGPLGRLAGLPFRLGLRLEERLARAALARDRARTTLTVGTLVVGLAMVVALGAVGANARGRRLGLARRRGARRRDPDGDRAGTRRRRRRRRAARPPCRGSPSRRRSPTSTSPSRARASRRPPSAAPTSPPMAASRSRPGTGPPPWRPWTQGAP